MMQSIFGMSEPPREKNVSTDWQGLLDPEKESAKVSTRLAPPKEYEAIVLEELFTLDECRRLIATSESGDLGYGKTNYPKKYRGNLRLITTDSGLAGAVWERIRDFVPAEVEMQGDLWCAVGLNECWRLAKYSPGDVFQSHVDACFKRNESEMSMFTVNVYMNGGFKGGSTRFFKGHSERVVDFACVPEPGSCVIFRQPPGAYYLHDGEELRSGHKYLFRTDVMYRRRQEKDHSES